MTYDLIPLPQFHWGAPGTFEIQNNIIANFDKFLEKVCQWIGNKIIPQIDSSIQVDNDFDFGVCKVNLHDYAVNVVHTWGDVFCGFGAYSVQEAFFLAG